MASEAGEPLTLVPRRAGLTVNVRPSTAGRTQRTGGRAGRLELRQAIRIEVDEQGGSDFGRPGERDRFVAGQVATLEIVVLLPI